MIACAQNESSRGTSFAIKPTIDLNQRRSESTKVIIAPGVSQMMAASCVRSSKAFSGEVSRMSYELRAATRWVSFFGTGTHSSDLMARAKSSGEYGLLRKEAAPSSREIGRAH